MNSRKHRSQTSFAGSNFQHRLAFGGSLSTQAKYRCARPISSRHSMHLVLKSSKAVGRLSFGFKNHPILIRNILDRHCAKYGVRLIGYSNNFNHLHMHLKFASRALYLRFVRSLTGSITMAVTKAAKTRDLIQAAGIKKFFDYRPFTRVITNTKAFCVLEDYIRLNQLEANGTLPKRSGRLRDVKAHEREHFQNATRSRNPDTGGLASSAHHWQMH